MLISVSYFSHFSGYTSFPFIFFLPLSQNMQSAGRTPEEEGLLLDDMVDLAVIDWVLEAVSFDGLLTKKAVNFL